jgi:hypothetical protein
MNCLEFQNWLQQRFDGAEVPPTPEVQQHLAQCADCRELHAASRLLAEGLRTLSRPPSSARIERIVAAVLDDRRQRLRTVRRRVFVTVGLAASLLLMMLASWLYPPPQRDQPDFVKNGPPPVTPQREPEAPNFTRRADDARVAMSALTERMADQTKEQAKLFLAVANTLELPPMTSLPALSELEEPLDPAAQSLRQTTQTVAEGIEPITRSARRAFDFFVNEMPMFDIPQPN